MAIEFTIIKQVCVSNEQDYPLFKDHSGISDAIHYYGCRHSEKSVYNDATFY